MRIVILPTELEVSRFAADIISDVIKKKSRSVLGFATGSSPLATYEILIEKYRKDELSFKHVSTFNLDEYVGLKHNHSQSYRYFMNEHLFQHIDIDIQNINFPECINNDFKECSANYESLITKQGGIDLQLLGLGNNGHIGFNEPTSSLSSKTRIKTLTKKTIESNSRFFDPSEFQPSLAITMGIGTILQSKKILLIVTGDNKKKAVVDMVEGPISAFCPASALQLHNNTVVVVDEAAAANLQLSEYYVHSESMHLNSTSDRIDPKINAN